MIVYAWVGVGTNGVWGEFDMPSYLMPVNTYAVVPIMRSLADEMALWRSAATESFARIDSVIDLIPDPPE